MNNTGSDTGNEPSGSARAAEWPQPQPTLAVDDTLTLRPLTLADVPALVESCNDPFITDFVPFPHPYTSDDATRFVTEVSPTRWTAGTGGSFAIAEADTDRLLGAIGITEWDTATRHAQVGYWLASWGRGRGAATAALARLTDWLFTSLDAVEVHLLIEDDNPASTAVARACGFTRSPAPVPHDFNDTVRIFRDWMRPRA